MQSVDDILLLLLGDNTLFAFLITNVTEVKPGLKARQVIKNIRQQEVQQGPQLTDVVLKRSTGQEQAIGRAVLFQLPAR